MSTPYIFELILWVMIYALLSSFELIERNTQMNSYLLVIIFLCFAFVGVARVAQPDLIAQTFSGFFKVKRPDNMGFEGSKLQPSITALMMGGFFLAISVGNKLSGMLSSLWDTMEHKENFFYLNSVLVFAAAILLFLMLKWLNTVMRENNVK